MTTSPYVDVRDVTKRYVLPRQSLLAKPGELTAVDGVSLNVRAGSTFALVGESGCGKSTIAKMLLRLEKPTSGTIRIENQDLAKLSHSDDRRLRRKTQVVLQDPYASMNPRRRIRHYVSEPISAIETIGRTAMEEKLRDLLAQVGLPADSGDRYPHEFSGGQRQRVSIARSLSVDPSLVILDEPVSALDVSVRAQILNLLRELQDQRNLTYFFISHDLAIVEFMADDIGVMYLGRLVETGPKTEIFRTPSHPYTRMMLATADPTRTAFPAPVAGLEASSKSTLRPGCSFRERCPYAIDRCAEEVPALEAIGPGHLAACHRRGELNPDPRW